MFEYLNEKKINKLLDAFFRFTFPKHAKLVSKALKAFVEKSHRCRKIKISSLRLEL